MNFFNKFEIYFNNELLTTYGFMEKSLDLNKLKDIIITKLDDKLHFQYDTILQLDFYTITRPIRKIRTLCYLSDEFSDLTYEPQLMKFSGVYIVFVSLVEGILITHNKDGTQLFAPTAYNKILKIAPQYNLNKHKIKIKHKNEKLKYEKDNGKIVVELPDFINQLSITYTKIKEEKLVEVEDAEQGDHYENSMENQFSESGMFPQNKNKRTFLKRKKSSKKDDRLLD